MARKIFCFWTQNCKVGILGVPNAHCLISDNLSSEASMKAVQAQLKSQFDCAFRPCHIIQHDVLAC